MRRNEAPGHRAEWPKVTVPETQGGARAVDGQGSGDA